MGGSAVRGCDAVVACEWRISLGCSLCLRLPYSALSPTPPPPLPPSPPHHHPPCPAHCPIAHCPHCPLPTGAHEGRHQGLPDGRGGGLGGGGRPGAGAVCGVWGVVWRVGQGVQGDRAGVGHCSPTGLPSHVGQQCCSHAHVSGRARGSLPPRLSQHLSHPPPRHARPGGARWRLTWTCCTRRASRRSASRTGEGRRCRVRAGAGAGWSGLRALRSPLHDLPACLRPSIPTSTPPSHTHTHHTHTHTPAPHTPQARRLREGQGQVHRHRRHAAPDEARRHRHAPAAPRRRGGCCAWCCAWCWCCCCCCAPIAGWLAVLAAAGLPAVGSGQRAADPWPSRSRPNARHIYPSCSPPLSLPHNPPLHSNMHTHTHRLPAPPPAHRSTPRWTRTRGPRTSARPATASTCAWPCSSCAWRAAPWGTRGSQQLPQQPAAAAAGTPRVRGGAAAPQSQLS